MVASLISLRDLGLPAGAVCGRGFLRGRTAGRLIALALGLFLASGDRPAEAIAYSTLATTWGWTASTAILGTLGSGGVGSSALGTQNGAAVYIGKTGTGTTDIKVPPSGTTTLRDSSKFGNTATYNAAHLVGPSATVGVNTLVDANAGARIVRGVGTLNVAGNTLDGTSQLYTSSASYTSGSGGTLNVGTPNTATAVTSSLANLGGTGNHLGVQGVASTLAANTDWNYSTTGSVATTTGAGRNGYTSITVSGQLTMQLLLNGKDSSDYFFIYLQGGISSTGSIGVMAGTIANIDPSHVIVVVGGATGSTIDTTTIGTYILANSSASTNSLTLGASGQVIGGVFLANTATTTSELIMTGGALITADPWNGWISSSAPEPVSAALLGVGLAGLGFARRRLRRAR